MRLPTFFISHGAPDMVLRPLAARDFLESFVAATQAALASGLSDVAARMLAKPRALVVASAHFTTRQPAVSAAAHPSMIYDFGGFPDAMYAMHYPAPGDPALAGSIAELLRQAGFSVAQVERGFDHGTWVPLMMMYPAADIPVVQLAIQPAEDPVHHFRLGQALCTLAGEGIVVIGSGSASHNLRAFFDQRGAAGEAPEWLSVFLDWLRDRLEAGATDDLVNWRMRAPHFSGNHPTDEHLLPLMVAYGAAGPQARGTRIHHSRDGVVLGLDCYAFQ